MTDNVPQFGVAEYPSALGKDICQPVAGRYYRINGALACERCKDKLESQLPKDSHSAFVRGLVFGVGGAILGLILYSAFGIITGLEIGYISLAVGYIVGKAMRMGSRGIGGRRYQIHGVIGLVILLVGIRIAWQLTASPKIDILGPFVSQNSPGPAATP